MRQTICLLVWSLALSAAAALAQDARGGGAYAGEERRAIKSLSADEVEALLQGRGMGLAKAAELNHYPGPMHVLELAAELRLTPEQRAATRAAFDKMRDAAVRLGRGIVARERRLDALFAAGNITEAGLRAETSAIARLQGSLRAAHLAAHLEMRRLLSPAQIKKYDELRGYAGGRQKGAQEDGHGGGHGGGHHDKH